MMAVQHAQSGEVIALPLGAKLGTAATTALVKTSAFEAVRLVMPAGKTIPTHTAPGPITVQCLEGHVSFTAHGADRELRAGSFLHLAAGEPHALKALAPSSLLLTIIAAPKAAAGAT